MSSPLIWFGNAAKLLRKTLFFPNTKAQINSDDSTLELIYRNTDTEFETALQVLETNASLYSSANGGTSLAQINVTGSSSNIDLNATTVTSNGLILNQIFDEGLAGLVPGPDSSAVLGDYLLQADGQWVEPPSSFVPSPYTANNYSLAMSVDSSDLTIELKNAAGSDPSAGSPATFSFRSTTAGIASNTEVPAIAATSVVVPSGATLGGSSGSNFYIYVYALNNAGTIELAVSSQWRGTSGVLTSTTISDAADDNGLYSTTGRSNVAFRLIGRLKYNTAPNGTYSTVPDTAALPDLTDDLFPEGGGSSTSNGFALDTAGFAAGDWAQFTNNSVVLQPGIYEMTGYIWNDGHSSNAVRYMGGSIGSANGANTGAEPTKLVPDAGGGSNATKYPSWGTTGVAEASGIVAMGPFKYTITTTTTVYANATVYYTANGTSTATLFASIRAKRVKG